MTQLLEVVLAELSARGILVPPGRVGLDTYGDSPGLSRELVALIREGRKRAGTSLLWAHEHEDEPLPEVGDVDVVVDHEGEGDGSPEHRLAAHWEVFGRECARSCRMPTDDMPVVCCVFELLAVVPDDRGAA